VGWVNKSTVRVNACGRFCHPFSSDPRHAAPKNVVLSLGSPFFFGFHEHAECFGRRRFCKFFFSRVFASSRPRTCWILCRFAFAQRKSLLLCACSFVGWSGLFFGCLSHHNQMPINIVTHSGSNNNNPDNNPDNNNNDLPNANRSKHEPHFTLPVRGLHAHNKARFDQARHLPISPFPISHSPFTIPTLKPHPAPALPHPQTSARPPALLHPLTHSPTHSLPTHHRMMTMSVPVQPRRMQDGDCIERTPTHAYTFFCLRRRRDKRP